MGKWLGAAACGIAFLSGAAHAQVQPNAKVLASCGTAGYPVGFSVLTIDQTGSLCSSGGGGGGGGAVTVADGADITQGAVADAAAAAGGTGTVSAKLREISAQLAALSTASTPGPITLVALDVATVTTGGTAVTALTAGHRNKGGWLTNPPTATVNLCINEITTASGTTSAGSLTCVVPGQTYVLTASTNAVSVISSDSSHPFSGYGWN